MGQPDRHIYLYAKGWYERSNSLTDMKKIMGERCGLLPDHIREGDIKLVLLDIVWQFLSKKNDYCFRQFMSHCEECGVIQGCLIQLALTEINEIGFDLGKPDSNILPVLKG
jgi:hypothetical protein